MDKAQKLRDLASWYREFAERTENPNGRTGRPPENRSINTTDYRAGERTRRAGVQKGMERMSIFAPLLLGAFVAPLALLRRRSTIRRATFLQVLLVEPSTGVGALSGQRDVIDPPSSIDPGMSIDPPQGGGRLLIIHPPGGRRLPEVTP
jgi:hypothetical protein